MRSCITFNSLFMKRLFLFVIALSYCLQSCIKDAPLNPEADIEGFLLDSSATTANAVIDQASRKIYLYLKPEAYLNGVVPVLMVSHGATTLPASGDTIRFDQPVTYTVTSQSHANTKIYTVEVVSTGSWIFNFEKWGEHPDNRYEYPLEDDGVQLWSSGNPGIALSGVEKKPEAYPTRATSDGYLGSRAAEIITLKGTSISELVGIKIFPGSLFLGDFNSSVAFTNPPAATRFGQPYAGLPQYFTGYYKYMPGTDFQDKAGTVIPGKTDRCAIYAVLFNGPEKLDGTNVNTSERIVARAALADGSAKMDFTRFDIPFQYTGVAPGNHLMLTIVASSSAEGDQYSGAIGSRLVVDSLRIIK